MSTKEVSLQASTLRLIYWPVLAIYAALVLLGVATHEPWRDEALSWLMCRDLGVIDLFKSTPIEGHPPLWYAIILPFAKLGLPAISQNYLTGFIMILSVWMLLFKTELPLYLKILLPFSYFFLYQYAVFARNQCLVPLFMVAIVAEYPKRFRHPYIFALLVIGLFNAHSLSFTLAGGIAFLFLLDAMQQKRLDKRNIGAFAAMCIGGGYLVPFFLLRGSSMNAYAERIKDHGEEITRAINAALLTYSDSSVAIIVFMLIAVLLLLRPKAFMVLVAGMVGIVYILGFKYIGTVRHQGAILFVTLGALGLAYHYDNAPWNIKTKFNSAQAVAILLCLTLLYQVKTGFESWKKDREELYSDGKNAAEFLMETNLEHSFIIAHRSYAAFSIFPYLPKDVRFFYPECMVEGSFLLDDSCHLANQFLPQDYAVYVADTMFYKPNQAPPKQQVLLLLNAPIRDPQLGAGWQLIYQTPEPTIQNDEQYFIYKR
ncbi:MAG: hypothetical protein QM642_01200 [Edaphocola sp.]